MTPIKELGECVIGFGDREFFFRPSFRNMARIGEPAEIVQAFYDLCNDEATPFAQRAAEGPISAMSTAVSQIVCCDTSRVGSCHAKRSWPRIRY